MLLTDKVAVVYGAGGSIGGAAARAFAREGARVSLAGRTAAPLDKVAGEIRAEGGRAETAVVDALEEAVARRRCRGSAVSRSRWTRWRGCAVSGPSSWGRTASGW
jgi:NADP-dependent 3-hydroxy acid dehydrogenase YdfG